jgi:demethoxyubiquinone hydroxylase (CLK1/Coq7/Cat5 family)
VAQGGEDRRAALVASITHAGAPRDFAESLVQRWDESITRMKTQVNEMKADAARAAREAADKAARGVSQGALWTFVAFLLGAISSTMGGRMGARSAMEAPVKEYVEENFPKREDVART